MPTSPIRTAARRATLERLELRLRARGRDGQTLTLEPFEGQPVVLAIAHAWRGRETPCGAFDRPWRSPGPRAPSTPILPATSSGSLSSKSRSDGREGRVPFEG